MFSPFTTYSTFDIRFLLMLLDVGSKQHARRGNCWSCCLPNAFWPQEAPLATAGAATAGAAERSFLRPCWTRRCRHGNRHLWGQGQIDRREEIRRHRRETRDERRETREERREAQTETPRQHRGMTQTEKKTQTETSRDADRDSEAA